MLELSLSVVSASGDKLCGELAKVEKMVQGFMMHMSTGMSWWVWGMLDVRGDFTGVAWCMLNC